MKLITSLTCLQYWNRFFKKSFFNKRNEKEFVQFGNGNDLTKVTIDNKHKELRYCGHTKSAAKNDKLVRDEKQLDREFTGFLRNLTVKS